MRATIRTQGPLTALALVVLLACALAGCARREATLPAGPAARSIRLSSSAFTEGGMIPREFTCDGGDKPPPLEWSGVPGDARSLALICEDPDAPVGTFTHWVLYNIDPGASSLGTSARKDETAPPLIEGKNDFGKLGYGGPCPPFGTHRYRFVLYALDQKLGLAPGASRTDVLKAIDGHIMAAGELVGKYAR